MGFYTYLHATIHQYSSNGFSPFARFSSSSTFNGSRRGGREGERENGICPVFVFSSNFFILIFSHLFFFFFNKVNKVVQESKPCCDGVGFFFFFLRREKSVGVSFWPSRGSSVCNPHLGAKFRCLLCSWPKHWSAFLGHYCFSVLVNFSYSFISILTQVEGMVFKSDVLLCLEVW